MGKHLVIFTLNLVSGKLQIPKRREELTVAAVGGNLQVNNQFSIESNTNRTNKECMPFKIIKDDSVRNDLAETRHRIQFRIQIYYKHRNQFKIIKTSKTKAQ